jgi:hypothetical protein
LSLLKKEKCRAYPRSKKGGFRTIRTPKKGRRSALSARLKKENLAAIGSKINQVAFSSMALMDLTFSV